MNKETDRFAAEGVWEKVFSLLGDCQGKIILDAPGGRGIFSNILKERGALVTSLDIDSQHSKKTSRIQADMNAALPFANKSFDRVISIEGIEHLENPSFLLRELSRILKDDGELILTTPNILNIRSRLKFLFKGSLFWFDDFAVQKFGHISPVSLYHLEHFSRAAGFHHTEIYFSKKIFWLNIFAFFFLITGMFGLNNYNRFDILTGEILIIKLRKAKKADPFLNNFTVL